MLSSEGVRESEEEARGSLPADHEEYGLLFPAIESYAGGASAGAEEGWRGGSGGAGRLPCGGCVFESMVEECYVQRGSVGSVIVSPRSEETGSVRAAATWWYLSDQVSTHMPASSTGAAPPHVTALSYDVELPQHDPFAIDREADAADVAVFNASTPGA